MLLEHWIDALRRAGPEADQVATIGRLATHLATLRRMSIAVTARLVNGESPLVEAALVKDLGTGMEQEIAGVIEGELGRAPLAALPDETLLRTASYVAHVAPAFSLRGGTREILRGMIARGLGLR